MTTQTKRRSTPWRAPGLVSAIVMALLLVLYLVVAGWQGILLLGSGNGVGIAMGVALLVFPVIGIWTIYAEFRFGSTATSLVQRLDDSDLAPITRPADAKESRTDLRALAAALRPTELAESEDSAVLETQAVLDTSAVLDNSAVLDTPMVSANSMSEATSWRQYMVWSLALDDAGQRKDARAAAREAIRRSRLEAQETEFERSAGQ